MTTHPYLRAYMAGVTVPTLFLPVVLTAFFVARFIYKVPVPIERAVIFPLALLPILWGLWNILYVWLRSRRRWAIGLHGAALVFLVAPIGLAAAAWALDIELVRALVQRFAPFNFPIALALYYLAWKYLVGFFNELLGIG